MQVTAKRIAEWAETREAQADLPRLVRRLVHAAGTPTEVAFSAGDSISSPGWDGEVVTEHSNAWLPKGKSYWELSCNGDSTTKANDDYAKRTEATPVEIRLASTLVVVSGRKWNQKERWRETKRAAGEWGEVRAFDADDLEQWLEQSLAVALQFAEELGLSGPGVTSSRRQWDVWASQSDPSILSDAFFVDRGGARDQLVLDLRRAALEEGESAIYAIKGDAVEEAAAFACAAVLSDADLESASVVVTEPNGWRFVEQNPSIKVAVATKPQVAESPPHRNGLVVVVPYAAGDMRAQFKGTAGQDASASLVLQRPRIYDFEKALASIGVDEAEAKRLAASTGRSWSVFRRRRARNPATRKPPWLDSSQASSLSTLCLLGAWSGNKPADKEVVARLAGRPYEQVERDLRHLSQMDDAPVLEIGEVWKAKSSLELLDLFGDRITHGELDRFFEIARDVLQASDPQVELPDEQRYAAQIYGKVRPQSGLLIKSLCDTLVKLAVRGSAVPGLAAADIEGRISAFVRGLLEEADGTRWLSLSSLLPSLAEAAPSAFLSAVEAGLAKADAPVARLLTESGATSLLGRCWHAGLLWGLETLAWAPERLTRVVLVLARLVRLGIKSNWANTSQASLVDIFRSWNPQTAADLDQRIAALDTLVDRDPDVAFQVLDRLVYVGQDFATPSARPEWRDDDAHAGQGVTNGEHWGMLQAAADRLIALSDGHAQRVAALIEKHRVFDPPRVAKILAMAARFTDREASDENRETIRAVVRRRIHWHRNYDDVQGEALDEKLRDLEQLYLALEPRSLVVRHRWLFQEGWPDVPLRTRDEEPGSRFDVSDELRVAALREILAVLGMPGIEELAVSCGAAHFVGATLSKLGIRNADLSEWIVERAGDVVFGSPIMITVSGLVRSTPGPSSIELLGAVIERGNQVGWDSGQVARFLVLAREERATWDLVASCGPDVGQVYWSITKPLLLQREDSADADYALGHLLAAGRPRSALEACQYDLERVDTDLLFEILERVVRGEEPEGKLIDSWHICEAVDRLEASNSVDKRRLVRLEFGLIPLLGYEGEQRAKTLYQALMTEPNLFVEVLCLVYKATHGEPTEPPPSEASKVAFELGWRVLHECRRQPGTRSDGTVDHDAFVGFIDEARRLARDADRLAVCDVTLGQILAYAPPDADGIWPFKAARDVLDRPELEDVRSGFHTGCYNKRGVTSRAPDEGGGQERTLADSYRAHARAVQNSQPNLAAALEDLARTYERQGVREDVEAMLSRERY
jgi:hypothetical protein